MKKKMIILFISLMSLNYAFYVIAGLLLIPFIFLFGGIAGLKKSYIDNNDLSYKQYKKMKSYYKK